LLACQSWECIAEHAHLQDGTHVVVTNGKAQTLHFHCCMGPTASQADVLEGCGASQLMDAGLAGYHATIFAYGQTGSGKTHTMFGHEDPHAGGDDTEGLTIRCMRHIFQHLGDTALQRTIVRVSCLEVYNEGVHDLLQLSSKPLPLKWDPEKGYWVPELKHVDCATLEKALHVAHTGISHRRTGAHALNHESSRSHAILTLNLEIADTDPNSPTHGSLRNSKISFVDLAGSERVKDTGAAGGTLKEANSINKSLFTLGKVISALSDPVRSSSRSSLWMPMMFCSDNPVGRATVPWYCPCLVMFQRQHGRGYNAHMCRVRVQTFMFRTATPS
jgi:Kinesin motor domain